MIKGYVAEIFTSFQGEGVLQGKLEYFIRLSGCNLNCNGCDTQEHIEKKNEFKYGGKTYKNPISPKELRDIFNTEFAKNKEIYNLNFTGGEPLVQAEFMAEFLKTLKYPGKIMLETNGTLPEKFKLVKEYIDFVSMDWKLEGTYGLRNVSGKNIYHTHSQFMKLTKGIKTQVKFVVKNNTIAEFEQAIHSLFKSRRGVDIVIQPFVGENGELYGEHEVYKEYFIIAHKIFPRVILRPQIHKLLKIR